MTDKDLTPEPVSSENTTISNVWSTLNGNPNSIYLKSSSLQDWFFAANKSEGNFPPYNLEQLSEDTYRLTMAVAGYTRSELSVYEEDGHLVIQGEKAIVSAESDPTFLHRGIALRSFTRTFKMLETMEVSGSSLTDGLLVISLIRIKPETKRKVIDIA